MTLPLVWAAGICKGAAGVWLVVSSSARPDQLIRSGERIKPFQELRKPERQV
jgi:hypothetical protein